MNVTHSQTPDYSTKGHMNFQHELQIDSFDFPKAYDSQSVLSSQSSEVNFTAIIEQDDSLQSIVDPFLSSSEESLPPSENHSNFPCQNQNMPVYQNFRQQHNTLMVEDATISSHKNQPYISSVQRESSTAKKRMRWNEDLHEQFVMIVNSLGGPRKAKPKAILKKMDSDLLTISHVKSHLQKHRTSVHMQKTLQEGFVVGHRTDGIAELQAKIHKQIEESHQLQLDVQKSLDQQLEIQRNLQVLIEQQRKHGKYKV